MLNVVLAPALLLLALATPDRVSFDPPSPRLGDPLVVYVQTPGPAPAAGLAEAFGYRVALVRVAADRLRGVIPVPQDAAPGGQTVALFYGEETIEAAVTVLHRKFDESKLTVSKKFTKAPDKSLKARLKREQQAMDAVWSAEITPAKAAGPLVRPVEGVVTGIFGTRRVFNGKTKSVHYGLDLDGKVGDPVLAVAHGRVVMSADRWGSGETLVLDHGGGLFTLYFHLSKRLMEVGDWVEAGQLIGEVGRTGRVTGPHLHLAVVIRSAYVSGKRAGEVRSMYVDPEPFLGLELDADLSYLERPAAPRLVDARGEGPAGKPEARSERSERSRVGPALPGPGPAGRPEAAP